MLRPEQTFAGALKIDRAEWSRIRAQLLAGETLSEADQVYVSELCGLLGDPPLSEAEKEFVIASMFQLPNTAERFARAVEESRTLSKAPEC